MQSQYADRVRFLIVYVREAHALDEWAMKENSDVGIAFAQPTTDAERRDAASAMCSSLSSEIAAVVDGVDDAVGSVWGGWPDRLFVVDEAGVVAYRGGVGPFGFKPSEVRELLAKRWGQSPPSP